MYFYPIRISSNVSKLLIRDPNIKSTTVANTLFLIQSGGTLGLIDIFRGEFIGTTGNHFIDYVVSTTIILDGCVITGSKRAIDHATSITVNLKAPTLSTVFDPILTSGGGRMSMAVYHHFHL